MYGAKEVRGYPPDKLIFLRLWFSKIVSSHCCPLGYPRRLGRHGSATCRSTGEATAPHAAGRFHTILSRLHGTKEQVPKEMEATLVRCRTRYVTVKAITKFAVMRIMHEPTFVARDKATWLCACCAWNIKSLRNSVFFSGPSGGP